jgi:hypothetical protein
MNDCLAGLLCYRAWGNGLLRLDRNSHDLLLTPSPNLSVGTNRRLSVTSTTCAGRPSALWGELAFGTEADPKRIGGHGQGGCTWR